jgi:hypothetical protein
MPDEQTVRGFVREEGWPTAEDIIVRNMNGDAVVVRGGPN